MCFEKEIADNHKPETLESHVQVAEGNFTSSMKLESSLQSQSEKSEEVFAEDMGLLPTKIEKDIDTLTKNDEDANENQATGDEKNEIAEDVVPIADESAVNSSNTENESVDNVLEQPELQILEMEKQINNSKEDEDVLGGIKSEIDVITQNDSNLLDIESEEHPKITSGEIPEETSLEKKDGFQDKCDITLSHDLVSSENAIPRVESVACAEKDYTYPSSSDPCKSCNYSGSDKLDSIDSALGSQTSSADISDDKNCADENANILCISDNNRTPEILDKESNADCDKICENKLLNALPNDIDNTSSSSSALGQDVPCPNSTEADSLASSPVTHNIFVEANANIYTDVPREKPRKNSRTIRAYRKKRSLRRASAPLLPNKQEVNVLPQFDRGETCPLMRDHENNNVSTDSSTENAVNISTENYIQSGLSRLYQIAVTQHVNGKEKTSKIKDLAELIQSKGISMTDPRLKETLIQIESTAQGNETELNPAVFNK